MFVVVGCNGQLGSEVCSTVKLMQKFDVEALSRNDLDITIRHNVFSTLGKLAPKVVINCSAYNKVDEAEKYPQIAMNVNAIGVKNLADACKIFDAHLVHISTNYVYGANASSIPYEPYVATNPVNTYGLSKVCGEQFITLSKCKHTIIRTSALYGHGKANNFVKKILAMGIEKKPIPLPVDQIFAPTYTKDLAHYIYLMMCNFLAPNEEFANIHKQGPLRKIVHYTNAGQTNWVRFAKEILAIVGLNPKLVYSVNTDEEFLKTYAPRPLFSLLASDIMRRQWDIALAEYLTDLRMKQFIKTKEDERKQNVSINKKD